MATPRRRAQQQAQRSQAQVNRQRNSNLLASYANRGPAKGVSRPAPAPGAPPAASPPGQPQENHATFAPDAEYLAAAAQRQFERTQAIQGLTSQSSTDKSDTAEAIRRLTSAAPEQRQGIKQGANKAGLFYSGQLGKQLGNFEADLTQRQGDINLDMQRREDARAAARAAIEQGAPLEEAAALAESAGRQVQRDATAADNNMLVPPPAAPAARVVKPAAPRRKIPAGLRRPPARRRPSTRR
jgi:hypothetical protein